VSDDEMREHHFGNSDPCLVLYASMAEAEVKAWEALSGYKFWMFGYHAARWVNYNALLPRSQRLRSPFKALVTLGREMVDQAQVSVPTLKRQLELLMTPEDIAGSK
jgi:hypothetical protein